MADLKAIVKRVQQYRYWSALKRNDRVLLRIPAA